jgi:hypothetical protein
MRWAKSYSIIDHQLLHGGYLNRLSHESMIMYLFLIVVGDKEGKSFYSEKSISRILRLSIREMHMAKAELVKEGLIRYQSPYWHVLNIKTEDENGREERRDKVFEGCEKFKFQSDRGEDRDFAKKCIQGILQQLGGN